MQKYNYPRMHYISSQLTQENTTKFNKDHEGYFYGSYNFQTNLTLTAAGIDVDVDMPSITLF